MLLYGKQRLVLDNLKIVYYIESLFVFFIYIKKFMVEPLLSGIVLGLIPVTLLGLLVAAFLQYRRGNEFGL